MASLLALKRSINSSFLFKTITNPLRSATVSTVFNPLRFFSAGSRIEGCNMVEKRNIADHKRRLLVEKYELRRKLYKALCKDPDLPSEMREKHRYKLSKLPRNSSVTRVRNRCVISGRPRAVYRKFRISRIVFRDLANRGALMGVKKASW